MFLISYSVCPWQAFQNSLMLVEKHRSLPLSGAHERCFTRVGSSLTQKHKTRLERPAIYKHSSLLGTFVNYVYKMFYSNGPLVICVGIEDANPDHL
jgi:hypothetical protein